MTGKLKKVLLPNLPYLLFVWLFDKLCQAVRLAPGLDASEKLLRIAQGFTEAFASLWLSLHPLDLLLGVAGAALVRLAVYLKAKNAKKYRRGVEYGSARWGRPEDIAPYIDPVPDWNIPLTRTESLTMTSRPKNPKTARNKNILVIGGSGSGKTRFFVKPSLLQMHSSYVVTDPKGQLLRETGKLLAHGGPKRDENGKPVRDKRGKVIYEPYRILIIPIAIAFIPQTIAQLNTDRLCRKFGKKKVFLVCGLLGAGIYSLIYFSGYHNFAMITVLLVLQAMPGNISQIAKTFFTPDTIEYTRYKTGKDCSGIFFSLNAFVNKLSSSIAASLGLFLLGLSEWVPVKAESFEELAALNVTQTQGALDSLWTIYMLIPAIGTILSVLVMVFYKLKDKDVALMAKCNAGEITREECEAQLSRKY